MIDPTELRPGCIILTSKERGEKIFLRGIVAGTQPDRVILRSDRSVLLADCQGIELNENWIINYRNNAEDFDQVIGNRKFEYVHQLQAYYYDQTGKELRIVKPVI